MAVDTAVLHEHPHLATEPAYRPEANRLGIWLFLFSETFLFSAALATRYYLVGLHHPKDLNQGLGLLITAVLLFSSLTAYRCEAAIAHDDRTTFVRNLVLTILLGLVFVGGVSMELGEAARNFPVSTTYGSAFFLLIGLHAFHVVTGLVILGIVLNLGLRGRFGSENHWMVEAGVKYWHFVDVAWVFIFPTLYLVK